MAGKFGWSFRSTNYDMSTASADLPVKVVWMRKCFPSGASGLYKKFIADETLPSVRFLSRRTRDPQICCWMVKVQRGSLSRWRHCPCEPCYTDNTDVKCLKRLCAFHFLRHILTPLSIGGQWCDDWVEEWHQKIKAEYYVHYHGHPKTKDEESARAAKD